MPDPIHCQVSIPQSQLKSHLTQMILMEYHLICIDVCQIHFITYFNLIWHTNTCEQKAQDKRIARPSQYLILCDLNTAQMAKFYQDLCIEKTGWNLELVDSYVKNSRPVTTSYRRRAKSSLGLLGRTESSSFPNTARSHDEIMYICQFKWCYSTSKIIHNKLKHSIIDKKFITEMNKTIQFNYQQNYMPIRLISEKYIL